MHKSHLIFASPTRAIISKAPKDVYVVKARVLQMSVTHYVVAEATKRKSVRRSILANVNFNIVVISNVKLARGGRLYTSAYENNK